MLTDDAIARIATLDVPVAFSTIQDMARELLAAREYIRAFESLAETDHGVCQCALCDAKRNYDEVVK